MSGVAFLIIRLRSQFIRKLFVVDSKKQSI